MKSMLFTLDLDRPGGSCGEFGLYHLGSGGDAEAYSLDGGMITVLGRSLW